MDFSTKARIVLALSLGFVGVGGVSAQTVEEGAGDSSSHAELFNSDSSWEGYTPYQEYLAACIAAGHDSGSCAELINSDPSVLRNPFDE